MTSLLHRWLTVVIAAAVALPLFGAQPPEPEVIVLPQNLSPETGKPSPDIPPTPGYYRTSRYAVWEFYAVDRFGMFRPRVIYSPYGAFYYYNGQPFPWTVTHQRDFMTYAGD
jgi:hypothetical protein